MELIDLIYPLIKQGLVKTCKNLKQKKPAEHDKSKLWRNI